MIANSTTERVKELLADGKLSNRQIARAAGVSRQWVDNLANGKATDCDRPDDGQEEERPPTAPRGAVPRRCACGAKVYGECVACRVRSASDQNNEA